MLLTIGVEDFLHTTYWTFNDSGPMRYFRMISYLILVSVWLAKEILFGLKARLSFILFVYFLFPNGSLLTAQHVFLLNGPSAELGGDVGAYAALPATDPLSFYHNPAQLGIFAEENMVSFSYPNYDNMGGFNNYATSLSAATGFVYPNVYDSLKVSIGLGYNLYGINYGPDADNSSGQQTDNQISESYHQIGIGFTFRYYIKFSMGFSLKSIRGRSGLENASTIGSDYGFILSVPLMDIYPKNQNHILDLNLAYSKINNGAPLEFELFDSPLPKEQIAGISLVYDFNQYQEKKYINILRFAYSSQAHNPQYRSAFATNNGSIDFMDNILKSQAYKDIYIKKTYKLGFYNDTFFYARHSLQEDKNFGNRDFNADTFHLSVIKALFLYEADQQGIFKKFNLKLSLTIARKIHTHYYYGITLDLYNFSELMDYLN
jgi:hypothetical protein